MLTYLAERSRWCEFDEQEQRFRHAYSGPCGGGRCCWGVGVACCIVIVPCSGNQNIIWIQRILHIGVLVVVVK